MMINFVVLADVRDVCVGGLRVRRAELNPLCQQQNPLAPAATPSHAFCG